MLEITLLVMSIQFQAEYDVPQPQLSVQGTFTTICQLELVCTGYVLPLVLDGLLAVADCCVSLPSFTIQAVELVAELGADGIAPQSLISFPVVPSNTARCQSTALDGPTTSPVPQPPLHIVFQLVQSYDLSTSLVVSYQSCHSYGLVGAELPMYVSPLSTYCLVVGLHS